MSEKLGRNNPCWCGSGLKHKRCHLGREQKTPPTLEDAKKLLKESFDKSYCLHPDSESGNCKGKIVNAHTIQRNGGLSKIAINNHVYKLVRDFSTISSPTQVEPKLIGIRKASAFTGFCEYHDTKTFERIEKHPFTGEINQIFLLAYRSLAREVFVHECQHAHAKRLQDYDRGLDITLQKEFQERHKYYCHGLSLGSKTLNRQKSIYDKALLSRKYETMNFFIILIDKCPEILCSGTSILEIDFQGNRFHQLGRADIDQDIITFSIIPTDKGGAVCFSTLDNSEDTKSFFNSLKILSKKQLPNAIARYTFAFYENTFISPSWWEDLKGNIKESLIARMSLISILPDDCLLDDGFKYVNWNITDILTS
ncbi:MAG: hypothetical protein SCARUB_03203 [Candidatus Scalindua rubra]|uniref:Uncharacterized protein n=1 Tax=Candidatus Scalindua rubra TaxID=1872076 RepID=A0A1E3X7S5_9BACT|nr:MAG: hypothetical protein SCARUB_03203 [Candidatus Scalindua rubra]